MSLPKRIIYLLLVTALSVSIVVSTFLLLQSIPGSLVASLVYIAFLIFAVLPLQTVLVGLAVRMIGMGITGKY